MSHVAPLRTTLFVLAAALFTSAVCAQSDYGSVAGFVRDPTGGVSPKARVTLKNDASGTESSTLTNDSGYYVVPNLPAGSYTVTVEVAGFKKFFSTRNKLD